MGAIETRSEAARQLQGLHLFHVGRSNCASRVRLLIEEKGLPWVSHYVDLYKKENISPEYFAINPKGVVPTLVHDGQVYIESNDILPYLEEAFPEPSFTPADAADRATMRRWLARSGDIHIPGVKTFAYARRNAALVTKSPEEVALYRQLQTDPDLLAFHAKHDLPDARISEDDVAAASSLLNQALGEMDERVGRDGWLVGRAYSLADISWATTITTLKRAGFPLEDFPHVADWYARIGQRPAWIRAIPMWDTAPAERVMAMPGGGREGP